MEHILPNLPYPKNALEPHLSAETLDYHYGKHHQTYVTNLNKLIQGTAFEKLTLEEIILSSDGVIFNNSSQVWNHTFYWKCLAPEAGGIPHGLIAEMIQKKWGQFEKFKEEFEKSATSNFGSGWTWLAQNKSNQLEIFNTANAQTPMTSGLKAILVLDVWEHAYYIDYRNSRANYITAFWNLVNWDFANTNVKDSNINA